MDKEIERIWEEFWKPIVVRNGKIDINQIKCELYDYHEMMGEVSKVFDHVTGGMISKPNTIADAVMSISDDRIQDLIHEAVQEDREYRDEK